MSLQARHIVKNFGGVKALRGVSFDVKPGEVHALCGENGAGKSTLMKILAGHYGWGTFAGDLLIDGVEQRFLSLEGSRASGISIVFQELSLAPDLTVEENLNLGRERASFGFLKRSQLRAAARRALEQVGVNVDLDTDVGALSIGVQQLVEIAKAIVDPPRFLILDEPTSALSEAEIQHFLKLIREFATRGIGCVLISHKLDEIFSVCDRITVLRDGESVGTFLKGQITERELVQRMVGREVNQLFPKRTRSFGKTVMKVRGLSVPGPRASRRRLVSNMSFELRAGEVLGISGMMGAGRSEAALGLLGAMKREPGLRVEIEGQVLDLKAPADWVQEGVVIATEDRKRSGLALQMSIRENLALASLGRFVRRGFVDSGLETSECMRAVQELGVKCRSLDEPVQNLSGGNQQKVVLGKCLLSQPRVVILDEPTRGIDVGAKAEIYRLIAGLSEKGLGLILISSELPELMGLCDRVLVMKEGAIVEELGCAEFDPARLIAAAIGVEHHA